jgi:glycosyltransferase involved in cell wall biosynthesis
LIEVEFHANAGMETPARDESEPAYQGQLRALLLQLPYFDREWYLLHYSDVREGCFEPLEHYLAYGAREGRRPNKYFDPVFYRSTISRSLLPDRAELVDYHDRGWWEGAQPSIDFDTIAYIEAYPDVAAAKMEPLAHYLAFGRIENRQVHRRKTTASETLPKAAFPSLLNAKYRKLIDNAQTGLDAKAAFNPDCLRIAWIIPDFDPGSGGHMAIFKAIYWLEFLGHEISIWIDYPHRRTDAQTVYEEIVRYFKPIKAKVRLLNERAVIRADVVMATDHQTVWSAMKHASARKVFYFVQDFEPLFFGMGSDALIADRTYDLSLFCFCSSPWLAQKMRQRGSEARHFIYPADTDIYFPAHEKRRSDVPLIAFYARFFTSRRAVELALLGLTLLAQRGEEFTVALFGQQLDEASEWPFPVEFYHVLSERELGELYRRADIGLVFSATNYSIAAVEMMACGLPIVDLKTESTLTSYPSGAAALAEPSPAHIATAIAELLHDADKREVQIATALRWAVTSKWPEICRMIAQTMVEQLQQGAISANQPAASINSKAVTVTVVIPTYNAGASFAAVLDRVLAQSGPYRHDVLCVDSGSSDETLGLIEKRNGMRLVQVAKNDFNHGRTRNFAIENTDSDYIVFLTQDALPTDELWLFNLVGLLRAAPSAALAFGRHFAYPSASPFVKRDIDAHFDRFKNGPIIVNRDTARDRFDNADPEWLDFLRFSSDNNSCIVRQVWESLPLPSINFGEDQLWAWNIITAGYSKVYVDNAAVYHSHDYDVEQTRRRARTEAGFFKHVFGVGMGVCDERTLRTRLNEFNRTDLMYALKHGLPRDVTERRFELNQARLEGYHQGEDDRDIVYEA